MKRKIGAIILGIGILASSIGCANNSGEVSAKEDVSANNEKKVVRLASATTGKNLGEVPGIAQEKKYYDEELEKIGYSIEYVNFPAAGPAVNEAFVGKSIDLAVYGELPPVILKSKGVEVSIIGTTNSSLNFTIVVQPNSSIKSVQDLKGKKVIVGKGTVYQQYFEKLIKENSIDQKGIEIINSVAEAQSTFLSKNADAYVTVDSAAKILITAGNAKSLVSTTTDSKELSSQAVLVGRNEYLKENPEVAVALIKAQLRAWDFLKKNPEEGYKEFSKTGIPIELIPSIYDYDGRNFDYFSPEITELTKKKLKATSDFLLGQGLIAKEVKPDDIVDTQYYEKAIKEYNKSK
jgi:sulfonate transport system substrate-binding protein